LPASRQVAELQEHSSPLAEQPPPASFQRESGVVPPDAAARPELRVPRVAVSA